MTFENQVLIFDSTGLQEDTLLVTRLVGTERISGLYRFELELASAKQDLDLQAILDAPARIGFREQIALAGGGTGWTKRWIAGELESFTYSHCRQGVSGYRAVLVPRLAQLEGTFRSRVFLDEHAPNIVKQILGGDDLTAPIDHTVAQTIEDALAGGQHESSVPSKDWDAYPSREYVVQYEETDLHFVSRWLEHEGIFYFFENDDAEVETLVLADGPSSYKPVKGRATIPFKPEGATTHGDTPGVHTLTCEVTRPPKQVVLKDYNWRAANEERDTIHALEAVSEAIPHGRGVSYEYNYHFKTKAQGEHLANVRAEGLRSRAHLFHGRSDCRNLRAGHTFELTDHDRADFNQAYLLTELRFEAEQNISLESRTVSGATFHCDFTAIPASETFRPEPETEWPAIRGVMHARIDGPDGAEYAELDPDGRYKVTLPFDQDGASDKKKERASRYIRMATPYAGRDQGMHFPLHPGTDVLLTHIDGDPDRPLIAGAVPNAFSGSVVDQGNHTRSRIKTGSEDGNLLEFEDEEGREGITIANNDGSSYMCFTKPGSMGTGGGSGGSGAGSGGAADSGPSTSRRSRSRTGPASQGLPSAGLGGSDDHDEFEAEQATLGLGQAGAATDSTDDGIERFFQFKAFHDAKVSQKKVTQKKVKTALNDVYGDVEKLNADCSTFVGTVGAYEVCAGGPKVEAVFGDVGNYAWGETKTNLEEFDKVEEDLLPRESGESGTVAQRVGSSTKPWDTVTQSVDCDEYHSRVGPAFGEVNLPTLVSNSLRGYAVFDTLFAVGTATFVIGGSNINTINFAASNNDLQAGLQMNLSLGAKWNVDIGPVFNTHVWTREVGAAKEAARIKSTNLFVSENGATLKKDVATLKENLAVVDGKSAKIKEVEAAIKSQAARIDENTKVVNHNAQALDLTRSCLNYNAKALNSKTTAISMTMKSAKVSIGQP